MIIPPWEMDERMKHAVLRDAQHWYAMNHMPWTARASVQLHNDKYGPHDKCEFCREVYESYLETAYKADSLTLFDGADRPMANPITPPNNGAPLIVGLPIGNYVRLDSLPEHVQAAIIQKANELG